MYFFRMIYTIFYRGRYYLHVVELCYMGILRIILFKNYQPVLVTGFLFHDHLPLACYTELMNQADWEASIQKAGVVVGCLIKRDGKYLLVRENPDGKAVYNLPAGHVDKDEQLEVAAIRETKEETGYNVRLTEEIALYHETAAQSVKHVYLAEIVGGEEHAQEGEILEVVWKSFDEIQNLEQNGEMRAPWVFKAISKFENRDR